MIPATDSITTMVRGMKRSMNSNSGMSGMRPGVMRCGMPNFKRTFLPRHPFDLVLAEVAFPRVTPASDDSALTAVSSKLTKLY